jgi:hypothetical protein
MKDHYPSIKKTLKRGYFHNNSLRKNKKRRPIPLNREKDGIKKLKSTRIRKITVQPTPSFSHDLVHKDQTIIIRELYSNKRNTKIPN